MLLNQDNHSDSAHSKAAATPYAVVDLFAGPGGLAEGFSTIRDEKGERRFRVLLSVEKDVVAHETLRLRAFVRQFDGSPPPEYVDLLGGRVPEPEWKELYPEQWQRACDEALQLELSGDRTSNELDERIAALRARSGDRVVLIGGPPCQAYSLVGRARNRGNPNYAESTDPRHTLYRAYVGILDSLNPAAFVMENVKGLLSSTYEGKRVLDLIIGDLEAAGTGYKLFALNQSTNSGQIASSPLSSDFVVRSETHGIPQARHRVIIVGIRADLLSDAVDLLELQSMLHLPSETGSTVNRAIDGLPHLRSGLTGRPDSADSWFRIVSAGMERVAAMTPPTLRGDSLSKFYAIAEEAINQFRHKPVPPREARALTDFGASAGYPFSPNGSATVIRPLANHEARGHMPSDLERYFFAAIFAKVTRRSPKASDFPPELAPKHGSWSGGKFNDRFRVQLEDRPSSTITSHISKDGHYYIHPDPLQCRSLTVREAARLQTFPDDYLFKGNRTQQYTQVGNAVPPKLASQIAERLADVLDNLLSELLPRPSRVNRKPANQKP